MTRERSKIFAPLLTALIVFIAPVGSGILTGPSPIVVGPQILSPTIALSLSVPAQGFAGLGALFQGVVLSTSAANGVYASTDAHRVITL